MVDQEAEVLEEAVVPAEVVARTANHEFGKPDFAVKFEQSGGLRVEILATYIKEAVKKMGKNPDLVKEIGDNPYYANPLGDSLAPITFVDRIKVPVFIAGMPRSGTSLLDQIIDAHAQAAGVGEMSGIEHFARELERGLFDVMFFADVHGVYARTGGSYRKHVESGLQIPSNDPLVLLGALAARTEREDDALVGNHVVGIAPMDAARIDRPAHL